MGGIPDSWTQPPTPVQLTTVCSEAAANRNGVAQLRQRIRALLRSDLSLAPFTPLVFKGDTVIHARGAGLAV